MKIISIVGARPQFVKEAIIQKEIRKYPDIEEIVVHTGQHYDSNMSGVFFDVLNMRKPEYNLGIHGKGHLEMTAKMMIELEKVMLKELPDIALLYGDTNSTLAGALVCAKLKIEAAHIEAGLRQEPKDMPEEINRVLTDHISNWLFASSQLGVINLGKEGISKNVHFVGDVMYDVYKEMEASFEYSLLEKLHLVQGNYIVMTLHRDFNVDNKEILESILSEVSRIAKELPVVFPFHPHTRKSVENFGLGSYLKDILVIEPIDYLNLMGLTKYALKIITDSGGYQKEAYFAGKEACILMPDTSWRELVECGANILVDSHNLYEAVFKKRSRNVEEGLYGDGHASEKILRVLHT
jgi:UDP-N-acetylglucosamine 2-epimerase